VTLKVSDGVPLLPWPPVQWLPSLLRCIPSPLPASPGAHLAVQVLLGAGDPGVGRVLAVVEEVQAALHRHRHVPAIPPSWACRPHEGGGAPCPSLSTHPLSSRGGRRTNGGDGHGRC
jgi:hypothetical protein